MSNVEAALVEAGATSVLAEVRVGQERYDVSFEASVPLFLERADALVPLALMAGMRRRETIRVDGPVSAQLLANVTRAQQILSAFTDGALRPVPVVADPVRVTGSPAPGTACCFSGGIDSFYSVLRHRPSITHLVYVHGFDVIVDGTKRANTARREVLAAADGLGLPLVEVTTDLRDVTDRYATWSMAHGAAIGVVSLLLQSQVGRVIVPSSFPYADLFPWGSHPLLDPLWGTETLEIVHDGCEASRLQKVEHIAGSDVALRHLRVCNQQRSSRNCGRCEKCIRTMVALHLAGALDRCATLPRELDLRAVRRMRPLGPNAASNWDDLLRGAQGRRDWSVVAAVRWARRPRPVLRLRRRAAEVRDRMRPPGRS